MINVVTTPSRIGVAALVIIGALCAIAGVLAGSPLVIGGGAGLCAVVAIARGITH